MEKDAEPILEGEMMLHMASQLRNSSFADAEISVAPSDPPVLGVRKGQEAFQSTLVK